MILTKEDIEFIDFAYGCINRAHYPASNKTVETYNRVFSDRPNFRPRGMTSCGSCLRQMVMEMKQEKDKVIAKFEKDNNIENKKKDEKSKLSEGGSDRRDNVRPSERNEPISDKKET